MAAQAQQGASPVALAGEPLSAVHLAAGAGVLPHAVCKAGVELALIPASRLQFGRPVGCHPAALGEAADMKWQQRPRAAAVIHFRLRHVCCGCPTLGAAAHYRQNRCRRRMPHSCCCILLWLPPPLLLLLLPLLNCSFSRCCRCYCCCCCCSCCCSCCCCCFCANDRAPC